MKRTSILLFVATLLMSLGFTTNESTVSKIYVFGDLLVRSNTAAGRIDFFDLSRPATLPRLASISIAGNNDIAIVDDILYADAGRDLVIYDIADLTSIRAIDTLRTVFNQSTRMVWSEPDMMVEDHGGMSGCGGCASETVYAPAASDGSSRTGTAGSMARFGVVGEHLYCIDYSELVVFDVAIPRRPQMKSRVSVGWELETLFPYGSTMFVGAPRGVYLVDISDPERPAPISQFQHGRGCDPVVVEDGRAYVTLRSGTRCGDIRDQMLVLDVSDLRSPRLLKEIGLTNPYGLAVNDGVVYVCDGTAGLKVIDARDVDRWSIVGEVKDIVAHDAIHLGTKLVVTTSDRAIVYDLSNERTPVALGSITIRE